MHKTPIKIKPFIVLNTQDSNQNKILFRLQSHTPDKIRHPGSRAQVLIQIKFVILVLVRESLSRLNSSYRFSWARPSRGQILHGAHAPSPNLDKTLLRTHVH